MQEIVADISDLLYTYILIFLLVGVGIYFGIRTKFVQFRLIGPMLAQLRASTSGHGLGISSFQAFAVGLASRVGTGNIAGVAIALTLGGPGAIFWMWCVALVGMATAFIEATLAQLFKVRGRDGTTFRGGPAFYISRGLGSRAGGMFFAILLIYTFGIAFNMVQANAISDVLTPEVDSRVTAAILVAVSAPILFGGVRRVARLAGVVVPVMALIYIVLALLIVLLNIARLPEVIWLIIESAFGFGPAAAGITGGLMAALLQGVKRGLFSNEAGMGSAPNAAATATTSHPAKQGLIQSLGVFVDTLVVCSATAFMIMMAGPEVYVPGVTGEAAGASLTQSAVESQFGIASGWLMAALVIVFAFSTLFGNYSYTEVNMDFLTNSPAALTVWRVAVLAAIGTGAVLALELVWSLADVAMGLMAITNLVAIILLGKWSLGALKDFEAQRAQGGNPVFVSSDNPYLPGDLPSEVWAESARDRRD